MTPALRNRIIPHTPARPRAFIGHGECGREYDGVFADAHCGGVVWNEQSGPVRPNAPQAGADRYEPGEVVAEGIQAARTKLVIAVCLVCVAVLGGLVWALLRWRAGATWN